MRVLFFAEAVTLAHVARPAALAASLDRSLHEAVLACPPSHAHFLAGQGLVVHPIESQPSERFLAALAAGRPVGELPLLLRQVDEDRRLIDRVRPDLVVGDFRLSLSVSARLARVPYATISNVYWSPHALGAFPMPVLPISRHLPLPLARALFAVGSRLTMPLHARPVNALRRAHGLPSLGADLRRVYTDADHVLYADAPGIFPSAPMPGNHHCIGPLPWAPPAADPPWWTGLADDPPLVYMNLGSSGSQASVLRLALQALAGLPCRVMVASAGQDLSGSLPANALEARYLHGARASARARLVVCNGGSMACQQALLEGRPILGIASNMDQFMNMAPIAAAGAGLLLRADRLRLPALREAAHRLLTEPAWAHAASRLGERLRRHDGRVTFAALLPRLVSPT